MAYLVSRYPAISHAFVQREVLALRDAGVEVHTFALRRAGDSDVLSVVDEAERDATYAIQPVRWGRLLADHARALATRPGAYAKTLSRALRLGIGARGLVWQLFYFAEAIAVWAEMRRRGLQHVHVHFANPAADVAMLATEFGGGDWRWSLTLHGPAEFFEVRGNRLPEKLTSAAFVACASDWSRSQAMSLVPAHVWPRFTVVRGGVDPAEWRAAAPESHTRLEVLNVGRLAPVKGQALLIDAIARLRDDGIDAHARIVGDGPERDTLQRRIDELALRDAVELTGPVGQDRIRELYAQADVFCLPSFREGLPFVLIEALAMELGVVATRIMGIPELVEDGESGLLVAPGRVEELAAALAELARDPERRRRLGAGGRATVERDYVLSRLASEMRELFRAERLPAHQ
ncbi:MAG TPA: glycosyltransferase [Thermoleophilaceae bacterium]|nr:glycosyltransferase [Thermoleophilaceae bacterium]